MHAYIEDIAKHDGQPVTIKGWLAGRRSSGKFHFLQVRDGSGIIQAVMSKDASATRFRAGRHLSQETPSWCTAPCAPTSARPGGYEIDVKGLDVVSEAHDFPITPKEHGVDFLMDHRHLWLRSARQQAILRVRHEVIDAVRDYFNNRGLHARRHADLHALGLRGHDDALPGPVLRRRDGVPHAERPALQRGQRDGARAGVLLRADVPRREVEDAPPPHRVLDGRARGRLRDARRRHRARRRPGRRGRRRACSTGGSASSRSLERDTTKLESAQRPFARITYDDAAKLLKEKGLPFEWGGDFGSPDETALSEHSTARSA